MGISGARKLAKHGKCNEYMFHPWLHIESPLQKTNVVGLKAFQMSLDVMAA